jgi:gliding motility-associated-like protein
MILSRSIVLVLTTVFAYTAFSQPCTSIGQTPSSAFPVCGTGVFTQTTVPLCGSITVPVPPCTAVPAAYEDRNPYWYKFTCFSSGTLAFLITPMDLTDDYDWQLFDVTGKNPNDVFTDVSCFLSCNWSGLSGVTGARLGEPNLYACAGNEPIFSRAPVIQQGRDYLLLVSHFTNSQAGYTLQFSGGTAVITDPLVPATTSAVAADCEGLLVTVRFNKKLLCNTLAADGSDFQISPAGTIQSVIGNGCSSGFDMDSVTLVMSAPLAPGNYTVSVVNGSDGNTLQDICGTGIPVNESRNFTITAGAPLTMGTIAPAFCSPSSVVLNLPDSVYCNSIAPDGSDFIVTGPAPVTVSGVVFTCDANGLTKDITLIFSAPVSNLGTYQVSVMAGSDGNTLIGRCNRRMNAGETATFTLADDPPATFGSVNTASCSPSVIGLRLNGFVQCNSIAADGSDFNITGNSVVVISSAMGSCNNGFTDSITIMLSSPVTIGGNYQLRLQVGSDGNTLLNNCNRASAPGSSVSFSVADTVAADFTWQISPGCRPTNVMFTHTAGNPVTSWNWQVNGVSAGNQSTCSRVLGGTNMVKLFVSNGACSDIDSALVDITDNNIDVVILPPDQICPGDSVYFLNGSTGVIDTWLWDFGNGSSSDLHTPPGQLYPVTGTDVYYTVTLTANNNTGCVKSKSKSVKALKTCRIEVPTGFTPNNDGKNDFLYPINGFNAEKLEFRVYNRWGQLVFFTNDWSKKWNGKINGTLQATDVFLWTLSYIDRYTGKTVSQKGSSVLIR